MYPFHETSIRRRVRVSPAFRRVRARDALVQPPDARCLLLLLRPRALRDADDPAHGAREGTDRILAIAREVVHAGYRTGMESLDEQRPDAGDECGSARVDRPHRAAIGKVSVVVALGELTYPSRRAVRIAGERGE